MPHDSIMKRQKEIFNTTSAIVMIFNGDGALTWINDAGERTLVCSRTDLQNNLPWPFFALPDGTKMTSMIHQALDGKSPAPFDIPVRCPGRSMRNIRWSTLLLCDDNNSPQKCIALLGMETAEKESGAAKLNQAEEFLESEAKYRSLVENIQDTLYRHDMEGKFTFINPSGARLLGYDYPAEVIGKNIAEEFYYHPDPDNLLLKKLQMDGKVTNYELTLKHRNGSPVFISTNSHLFYDGAGNVLGVEGLFTDITQRKLFEEKLTKVFMMTPECIAITRISDGTIIDVNVGFEEITGWKRSEAIGRTSLELKFWDDPQQRNRMVSDLKAGRDVRNREFYFRRNDGYVYHGLYSARTIQIAGEDHLIFVLQDISQRIKMEKILQRHEERLRAITNNLPVTVFQFYVLDGSGEMGLSYVNGRVAEVFGVQLEVDEMFPFLVSNVHEEDREKLMASICQAIISAAPWDFEGRYVKPSGEVIWCHGLSTPTRKKDRIVFDGIFLDVTERKQAEEMSRLSEEKFSQIFMLAPEMVLITRVSDGVIADANLGFEEISGWKHDEAIGQTSAGINFWVNPADRVLMTEELQAGRDVIRREILFRRKDGSLRTGLYSARFINIAGELHILFLMQDVTDQRRLEEDRRKLEQQLQQSQKMDAIGQLASGVAHDFNNILTGIQGQASLMMMAYDADHPHYRKLSRIEESVTRGAKLTRQLLGFARGGKYEVKTLSLNDLVRKTVQFFLEAKKEIEADFQLQQDLYPVDADAGQIEQVLLNIYINAGHAMPGGGALYIRTCNVTLHEADAGVLEAPPGDYVRISISDTGIGMDQPTLKRIFEPFFTTKSAQGGTGLGLASAYGVMRNHGGAIHADSEPGRGSTFHLYLPSSKKKIANESRNKSKGLISGSGNILLVDDDTMILTAASEMLKILGYTVYQAGSGQEAVSIYAQKNELIDLIILDMILPGINGAQTLRMLQEINPQVRVILSSGYSMQGEVQKVMESGCLGFIQKPYIFADLSTIVHRTIRHGATAAT